MATIKRKTESKKPAQAALVFNLRAEAHACAEALVAAADMRSMATAELGGATGLIRDSLVRMHAYSVSMKQDFLLLAYEFLGNGERGKNATKGLIREECAAMKSERAGDVACSQGRTIARWMVADAEAFGKALLNEKGEKIRLKDLYDSAVALGYGKGKRRKAKAKTESKEETLSQFIARIGVGLVLKECSAILKAAHDDLKAKTLAKIAEEVK